MKILIKGGKAVIGGAYAETDILIEDGIIKETGKNITAKADKVIDAKGLTVMPGLVDMHVHLREPGFEYKETILTGTKAAVRGGVTSVACMPNTSPVCDNEAVVAFIRSRAKDAGYAKVYPIGAITKGSLGKELAEMYSMKKAGIAAVSDDGRPVSDSAVMRRALEYAKTVGVLVISHCEELSLSEGGMANEGYNATITGLAGISRAAEEIMVSREILLAEALNARVHIAHVSTKGSVELIRQAKLRGVAVTAETCPHYFAATDELLLTFNSNTKVNPPLRAESDRQAIMAGLADGTIDAIVTDHAPHHMDDKRVEYAMAANGISGIETSFALGYTYLVKSGKITLNRLVELMSVKPAEILGIPSGIATGAPADITLADLDKKFTINPADFVSKGKNTPFNGYEVYGAVRYTIVDGKVLLEDGKLK